MMATLTQTIAIESFPYCLEMDGKNRAIIHNTGLYRPYALTLDIPTQTLYWADGYYNRIEKSNVDGTNRVVLARYNVFNPLGIVYDAEFHSLYFTDYASIKYLNTSGGRVSTLHTVYSYASAVYGIQIVDPLKQILGNLYSF